MSKRANPTLIGAFVVGGITIAIAAILALTGGQLFFSDTKQFVLFFRGSVKGLTVGSQVNFRGVNIGTVTNVLLVVGKTDNIRIPVIIEIDNTRFINSPEVEDDSKEGDMDELIQRGLRGQLQMQSLLTGQLFVQLDYHPDSAVDLVNDPMFRHKYREIPTIPTPIERITRRLEDFPLDKVLNNISSTMDGINKLVNSEELRDSITSLHTTLDEIKTLVQHIDKQVDPLAGNVTGTLQDARTMFGTATESLQDAKQMFGNVNNALSDAEAALKQARTTMASAEDLVTDEKLLTALDNALREISAAAYSIRILAESINNQPESLIRGRR